MKKLLDGRTDKAMLGMGRKWQQRIKRSNSEMIHREELTFLLFFPRMPWASIRDERGDTKQRPHEYLVPCTIPGVFQ